MSRHHQICSCYYQRVSSTLLLGIILGFPLALGMLCRVSVSHIFFSVMAGELLGRYFGHDLQNAASSMSTHSSWGEPALIIAPMLLTAFLLRGTLSHGKLMLNLIPLALTGIVFSAFLLPVLPAGLQESIASVPLGKWLLELNRVIVGGVIVLQLVALWLLNNRSIARRKRRD